MIYTMINSGAALALMLLLGSGANAFVVVPSAMTPSLTASFQLNAMSFDEPPKEQTVLSKSDLPGNFGFDPLHLAQTQQQLVTYRKAEVKHGRLAILAVMAILWSDLHMVDNFVGATPFLEGRAFPEFLGACVGLPASLELYGEQVEEDHANDASYFPGQLDLDPFHMYPASTRGQQRMQFVEIMAGRVCMLAAATRLTQYLLVGMGILGEEENLLSLLVSPPAVQTAVETIEEVVA